MRFLAQVRRVFAEVDPADLGSGFPEDEYDEVADFVSGLLLRGASIETAVERCSSRLESDWSVTIAEAKRVLLSNALDRMDFEASAKDV